MSRLVAGVLVPMPTFAGKAKFPPALDPNVPARTFEAEMVLEEPAVALTCTDPSGNLKPPLVDSTVPATESFWPGVVVPMPTLPFTGPGQSKTIFPPLSLDLLKKVMSRDAVVNERPISYCDPS